MATTAQGTFTISMTPDTASAYGRMTLAKQYDGELAAGAGGEMLSAMTATPGAAGYVALERVEGTLKGRQGSFVMLHMGTMADGQDTLSIVIVPHSGTEELTGIAGKMVFNVADGSHRYTLEYTLPQ